MRHAARTEPSAERVHCARHGMRNLELLLERQLHARGKRNGFVHRRFALRTAGLLRIVESEHHEIFEHFDIFRIHHLRVDLNAAAFMTACNHNLHGAVGGFTREFGLLQFFLNFGELLLHLLRLGHQTAHAAHSTHAAHANLH